MEIVGVLIVALHGFTAIVGNVAADQRGEVRVKTVSQEQMCGAVGMLAEQIMRLRQQERPMSQVVEKMMTGNAEADALTRSLIVAAYEESAMRTDANKANQLARFRNDAEVLCYSGGDTP